MDKLKVLLADDHVVIRNSLKQILAETEDLVVAGEAVNGVEVMQLVSNKNWDVLVLDLSMPGRNGLDLIQSIKSSRPKLPIVIFSLHNEKQYAIRALGAGASDYLTKDSDSDLLVAAIRRVANSNNRGDARQKNQAYAYQ